GFFYFLERGEGVEAVAAGAQLSRRLGTAQQEERHQRLAGAVETPTADHALLPLLRARPFAAPGQDVLAQPLQGVDHLALGELHDRLAVRLLVAAGEDGVDRQRAGFGGRLLLFEQDAQDADLDRVELAGDAGRGHVLILYGPCNLLLSGHSVTERRRPLMENAVAAPAVLTALSDEEVVARIRTGEGALFEILMRRYNQRLFRVALGILGNAGEAEDVMQDAYVRAYTHLDQFAGHARFATWLTRIAVYEALARARRRRRVVEIDAMPDFEREILLGTDEKGPEQRAIDRDLVTVLEDAIRHLPETYRP